MTEIFFHQDATVLPPASRGVLPVLLYGRTPPQPGYGAIGGPVWDAVRRLGVPVHQQAFDLLTIAMAVTAADTFVDRLQAADGWARELKLKVPLLNPGLWREVAPLLKRALSFLSGDSWEFEFVPGGPAVPRPQTRGHLIALRGHDCVSLFSGGLDSTVGVLNLMSGGAVPLLVSHSYRGDAERQKNIARRLPVRVSRFSAVANPVSRFESANDVQMRTRSFNFLAFGALVGATMAEVRVVSGPTRLFVPENGLIALNPPLTYRRIGSLSTRTTHPYFLELMQQVLDYASIPVVFYNPFACKTKGEMIAECANSLLLEALAADTVSCGKWKRSNMQCGKCVPCLIRRASFYAAGVDDNTEYSEAGGDLSSLILQDDGKDDLVAMLLAVRKLPSVNMSRWVQMAGPLPQERNRRDALLSVANRGLLEVQAYFSHLGLLQ